MSAKSYYEAHLTMLGNPELIKNGVEGIDGYWKFSKIDGDPSLGDGVKCYATAFFRAIESKEDVLQKLHIAANTLTKMGIDVIRRKIELVIFDDRSSTVTFECNGLCPECSK